jgi:hypothetical protein
MFNLQLQKKIVFIVKKLLLDYRSEVCLGSADAAAVRPLHVDRFTKQLLTKVLLLV